MGGTVDINNEYTTQIGIRGLVFEISTQVSTSCAHVKSSVANAVFRGFSKVPAVFYHLSRWCVWRSFVGLIPLQAQVTFLVRMVF